MRIDDASVIVIKIGSALLVNYETGEVNELWLKSLVDDVVSLKQAGKQVVLVSSGSVALGRRILNVYDRELKLEEKQAAAACGQSQLIRKYEHYFQSQDVDTAQILITIFDSENRRNYLNVKNTIEMLLANNVVPIINENDTVATHELRFGDNDRLAARVAQMISADVLVLLSDVDGLYTANPKLSPKAEHIPEVREINDEISDMAGGAVSGGMGSGGMITKIEAARIATASGCHTVLTSGVEEHPIGLIDGTSKATWFISNETPMSAKKRWIASNMTISGDIIIDDGACRALSNGNSLLPAGVIDVKGEFSRGDTVNIVDARGTVVGRGLVAYASKEAKLIKGQQSSAIENIVGFSGRNELVHRDEMVVDDLPS